MSRIAKIMSRINGITIILFYHFNILHWHGYNETGLRRNLKSSILGCEIRYLRKLNYTVNATKIDPLLAEFMQGRRGNVSQRHYFLPLMNNNRKKWVRVWNKFLPSKI